MQNINKIMESQDRAMAALTTLQHLYATAANIREVAVPFLELAVKAARCEGGILAMRDAPQGPLSVLAAIGDRQELVRQQVFNEGEGLIGEVVKSGMELLVPDARREPRLRREDGPDFIQREARNALCVPVAGSSCVWGAILLVNTIDRKRFAKQDVDLQTIFALRLAREMEREAEFAKAREEATRLSTLLRATELLHVAADHNKVAELLVQLAVRLARASGAAVFVLEESAHTLTCIGASEKPMRPVVVPAGAGVAGWVALEGKALNVNVVADPRFAGQFESVFSFRVEHVLAVPIRGAQRTLGVLEVVNREGGRLFDQGDVNLLNLLGREGGIAMDHLTQSQANQRTIMELLRGMAKYIDAKNPQLAGHSERVARISQAIAEEMKLSPDEIGQAYLAGLLHDIGNVGVDDDVFLAPRTLTEEEAKKVRHHASIGAEILHEVGALRHLMVGPLYHHERYDGTGYPQGLKGEAIPLLARIVGAAEAFDALRSPRPYREALSLPDALAHLRTSAGTVFDANVVSTLISAYQRGKLPA